jgi:hypothetical protein
MIRKYEDRYTISINVERLVYSKFNQLLPKGVYISDELNEFMKQRVTDLEKESKDIAPNKSAVRIYEKNGVGNNSVFEENTEPTLDIYGTKNDLVIHVTKITDSKTAWKLRRNAQLLCDLAQTKAKKLQKEEK